MSIPRSVRVETGGNRVSRRRATAAAAACQASFTWGVDWASLPLVPGKVGMNTGYGQPYILAEPVLTCKLSPTGMSSDRKSAALPIAQSLGCPSWKWRIRDHQVARPLLQARR